MRRNILYSLCLTLYLLCFSLFAFAEESITITSYYPSPYGSYGQVSITDSGATAATNYALYLTNTATSSTTSINKYGMYISSTGTWNGASANNYGLYIDSPTGGTNNYGLIVAGGNVGIGTTAPTYQLQLSTDSAAKPTANTWTVASDSRIKKNITDFTDGLDIVMKLKPRAYQYNGLGGQGYNDTDPHIGFIAQEVEPVAPYMIETGKGTIGGAQVDDFKSYQGHALSFILVNAIQQQQKQIEALKSEISQLKEKPKPAQ